MFPNIEDTFRITHLHNCARCGAPMHTDLLAAPISRPFDPEYPYYTLCPNGGGPILIQKEAYVHDYTADIKPGFRDRFFRTIIGFNRWWQARW